MTWNAPAHRSATHSIDATTQGAADTDAASTADAATSTDSGTSCVLSSITNYCTELPALAAAPDIDGVLDCGPTLVDIAVTSWTGSVGTVNC